MPHFIIIIDLFTYFACFFVYSDETCFGKVLWLGWYLDSSV